MNLPDDPNHKRFDILNHVPFTYYSYAQHVNNPSNEYLCCKLAPISLKRECATERLPSIKELHIINICNHKISHCPPSPQSLPSRTNSRFSSPSSPVLSSASSFYECQAISSEHIKISHKIEYTNKLRFQVSKRTCINGYQTSVLCNFYRTNKYPTSNEKANLSKQLNLTERTIQIWFQNKRQNRGSKFKLN